MLQKDRVRYILKKPGRGRARFSILKDIVKPNGKRTSGILRDERIESINHLFKTKLKDATECELELRDIIKTLYLNQRHGRTDFNEENRRLLQEYWEREYANRGNIDLKSAENDLKRAIDAIGTLSLVSASRDDLQNHLNKYCKGNKQRRIVARVNQLLKFLKRDIKLRKAPKERRKIRHLSQDDFLKVLPFIEEREIQALFVACFVTGARIGEAFALDTNSLRNGVISILRQMDRTGVLRETKNRRDRQMVINPIEHHFLNFWLSYSDKAKFRNIKLSSILMNACKKAFPSEELKWCNVHDLRHSYAIWLLSKGISLSLIAQSLGNSISVCQEYYAGFELSQESIESIKSFLKIKSP